MEIVRSLGGVDQHAGEIVAGDVPDASRIAYQGSDVMSPLGGLGHGEAAEATGCPDNQEPHCPKTTATPGFHAEGLPSL